MRGYGEIYPIFEKFMLKRVVQFTEIWYSMTNPSTTMVV